MIPIALSWAVTAHIIAGLSESAFVESSIGSVEHLRRNVLRTFERAIFSAADVSDEGASGVSTPVSERRTSPRFGSEVPFRSNVVPFRAGPDPSQQRITLTVAELVEILKASNSAPESLSAALAAAGLPTNSSPTRPGRDE